ncbi:MAG TPA: PIN domain-containing protein [Solirubrobacteraceae bacterium]|jgi:predicted nucleic acid-binding protein|nr:PIN domain-containing protein [Solirubrobacteraceae bacterium]
MRQLADTSAWQLSRRRPALQASFNEKMFDGRIATCATVSLEILQGARNGREFDEHRRRIGRLPQCPIEAREWSRAIDVYRELAHQGGAHQRSVGDADLLIAAAAESAGVELLHYDEDFDRIAAITGQPTRWIVPRGSI